MKGKLKGFLSEPACAGIGSACLLAFPFISHHSSYFALIHFETGSADVLEAWSHNTCSCRQGFDGNPLCVYETFLETEHTQERDSLKGHIVEFLKKVFKNNF
ncbi:hypothetical protein VNO78_00782 [Psophocarpus tetragonolobus]|uniref:Uncharacterized protein n=1 Tax=Psophocarpus tetragonolobus TaxID=3891 RepID=A0AAN9XV76_PSOTE